MMPLLPAGLEPHSALNNDRIGSWALPAEPQFRKPGDLPTIWNRNPSRNRLDKGPEIPLGDEAIGRQAGIYICDKVVACPITNWLMTWQRFATPDVTLPSMGRGT